MNLPSLRVVSAPLSDEVLTLAAEIRHFK